MKHTNYKIVISTLWCLLLISVSIPGCRRGSEAPSVVDSTRIQQIIDMQQRGTVYRNQSLFEQAIATHDSCIRMAEDIHDTMQLVIALNNQGTNFRRLSSMQEASNLHYRALELSNQYSDHTTFNARKNRVRALNGLGNIFMSIRDFDSALDMFRQALEGERELDSYTGQAINLANIGSIKTDLNQLDSARIYYQQSMEMNQLDSNMVGVSLCYSYLGDLDNRQGDNRQAIEHYRQAFHIGQTTGDVWHWLTPCISLSELFVGTQQLDSASKYITIGMEAAEEIHSVEHLSRLYNISSQVAEQRGNMAKAYSDLRMCSAYNDSTVNEADRNQVQNLRANYEANRRSIEVSQAEAKATFSRWLMYGVIIITLLILVLIMTIFYFRHRSQKAQKKAAEERELFYRNVTHQLRTPMTVVVGMIEQLKDHIATDDSIGLESLQAVQRQSNLLLDLIKQLIAASKDNTLLSPQGDISTTSNTVKSQDSESRKAQLTQSTQPAGSAGSSLTANGDMPDGQSGSASPSILLAEDNDDVAMMMVTLLRDHGYNVTRAADGQEALELLQGSELPDLLLTDIAMPRMDGLQLMRHVREDETMCHLPIIVASARVEDSERMEGINAGAEVYLTKPFIPEELLLRVKKILEQRARIRRRYEQTVEQTTVQKPASQQSQQHENLNESEKKFLDTLDSIIESDLQQGDLSVNYLADKMNVSASTINRRVKNITDMPLASYVRSRRLQKAKMLLATTRKSIADIEVLCGFNTQGYFARTFKAEVGISPTEYRAQFGKK